MKRILVISPSWVGDIIMMQPILETIKEMQTVAHITIMAPLMAMEMIRRMSHVDDVIENPFPHGKLAILQRKKLGITLRGKFDQVYVLPNSWKSALVPFFAKIPERIGFVGEFRYGLLNKPQKLDKSKLPMMVQRYSYLANQNHLSPVIYPVLESKTTDQKALKERLQLNNKPALAICPGAEYGPAKQWPASHFRKLIEEYVKKGYQIWIIGSKKEIPFAQEIMAALEGDIFNFCGKTKLEEAVDLLAMASKVVSNDSGLMHISAALNRPLVAIFGSSSAKFTPPLSEKASPISLNLDCSPCFKRNCPLGHTHCLSKIEPELIEKLLESRHE